VKSREISRWKRRTMSHQSAGLTERAYCNSSLPGVIPTNGRSGGCTFRSVLDPAKGETFPGAGGTVIPSSMEGARTAKYLRVECVCRQRRRAARPGGSEAPAPRTIALIQRLGQSGRALFARCSERTGRKCRELDGSGSGESRTCPTRPFNFETVRVGAFLTAMEGQ
jgi:hypothetical protein